MAEDGVGLPQHIQLFLGDVADDAHSQARAGKRLALDERLRQAKLPAESAHLVLKQAAQRLD